MEPEPAEAPEQQREPLPELAPAERSRQPQGWTYWDLVVVVVFALGAQLAVTVLGLVVLAVIGTFRGGGVPSMDAITKAWFVLPVQFVWWLLVFWVVYRIVRARDPRPFWDAIGWVRPSGPLWVYFAGGVGLALSVAGLARVIPMPKRKLPIEELFKDPTSAFFLAGFGVLIAPVIEELVFRGFLYPVVEREHGPVAAVAATSILFAVVHAPQYGFAWQNILLLAYVGVVLGTVRAVTRSLAPSTLVHAAYNFTLFAGAYTATNGFQNF